MYSSCNAMSPADNQQPPIQSFPKPNAQRMRRIPTNARIYTCNITGLPEGAAGPYSPTIHPVACIAIAYIPTDALHIQSQMGW